MSLLKAYVVAIRFLIEPMYKQIDFFCQEEIVFLGGEVNWSNGCLLLLFSEYVLAFRFSRV